MAGNGRTLISGGTVVSPLHLDGTRLDVLIDDGVISQIAPHIEVPDATVIDASDMVVSPGFVDTHRHTWQSQLRGLSADWSIPEYLAGVRGTFGPRYTPDDVYAGTLLGCAEALDAGVTTVLDWAHIMNSAEHADASVQALKEFGGRAVFGHGTPNDRDIEEWYVDSVRPHPADLRRIRDQYFSSDGGLLTLAMAARGPQHTTLETSVDDWQLARELGIRITVHVGEGAWGKRHEPVLRLHNAGVTGPDTTYVHANRLSDAEFQIIAQTGGSISVAPEVEMHMGHGYPATGRALAAGIQPCLSVDVVVGVGGDMFSVMRAALAAERARLNDEAIDRGEMVERLGIRTADILRFATIEGARACGLDDRTGSLDVGKEADIVLLAPSGLNLAPLNNALGSLVLAAHPGNVDTVIVAGRVVKRNGRLLSVDIEKVRRLAEDSRDNLYARAGVSKNWQPDDVRAWSDL
jgi:cytosine/adenosine deaminase-related metal-dependent hydrolase